MFESDPRIDLSGDLLPEHALAAVAALDDVLVRVIAGESDAAGLTAAALLTLVTRTHAHVVVEIDRELTRNPGNASSLTS